MKLESAEPAMSDDLWQRAARGDLDAQRASIEAALELGRQGLSGWRSSTEHALFMARMAFSNSKAPDDLCQVIQMLNLCIQHATAFEDLPTVVSYSAEFVARVDELADAGDERAAVMMATTISKIDPDILAISKTFRQLWDELAAGRTC